MIFRRSHRQRLSGNNYYEDDMGNRLDVTIDQFLSVDGQTPYDVGRKGWFLTKNVFKRSQQ